jgi:hypothetical protein
VNVLQRQLKTKKIYNPTTTKPKKNLKTMNAPTESNNNILYLARLKGTVSPDQISLKVVWFIRPRLGHVTLDIKKIFYFPFNFVLAVEILMRPTLNTH